ncbi:glutathione S-transferase C-terminal domain-containing protein [Microbulbifer agarilyticus]|uniref:glutathione S-transferase N-terminal domain-containing protein n=1 Tax=Microbulbifer agarilyticus TaxID=260552 RepID=UPI001C97C6D2|nr:glutathione S-transferase N-terminal domain-containing protein [Microbulbifer agarilyticus]MBY6211695.1 glutathione S-transferase C-terminal domain-containing protein [Microbulbifer agarilyticus]
MTASLNAPYTMYGIPASLYTAKVRCYMRKQGIGFTECGVNHPQYQQAIVPQLGRIIMPVVESAAGEVIQDGTDIIDYFEQQGLYRQSAYPDTPLQQTVAHLFELFGGEGMLRPAMHYRWHFDEENLAFLKNEFCAGLVPPGTDEKGRTQLFDWASGRMRKAAVGFGAPVEARALIEQSYAEFLGLFSEHLSAVPYLLGGRPTLGDYGLTGPLYGHMARDPKPAALMRETAPRVARWVERMHAPEQVAVEYAEEYVGENAQLFADDAIPETLKALMCFVAEEYLPELAAHVAFANQWLRERPDLEDGSNGLEDPTERIIGKAEFQWRGISLSTWVMPYRFYLLQRIQDSYDGAAPSEQEKIAALFAETGLEALLTLRTDRRVERKGHLEVWGPLR